MHNAFIWGYCNGGDTRQKETDSSSNAGFSFCVYTTTVRLAPRGGVQLRENAHTHKPGMGSALNTNRSVTSGNLKIGCLPGRLAFDTAFAGRERYEIALCVLLRRGWQ